MRKIYWLPLALLPALGVVAPSRAQTTPASAAATSTVTGTVRQASDRTTLPGVTVLVKGNPTIGASTDAAGRYTITGVPVGAVLVFSFVGYSTKEGRPEGGALDISLAADAQDLDEVVVLAYGIKQERRDLVTAVQEVTAKDIIDSRQTNLVNALQGKVAGVNITSSGGGAGEGASIVIRGGTSLDGDNQPLFVIDGLIMDNSSFQESTAPGGGSAFNGLLGRSVGAANRAGDINPEDVASMTILKGPAAAALYGLRAANGAVIITTKKGAAGRTQLNYRTQFSVDEVSRLPKLQDQYGQGSAGVYDASTRISFGPRFAPGQEVFDNVGNYFRKGYAAQNFVTMSGGSEKASFFASASNLQQSGVTPNSHYDKTTVRLSGSAQLSPKLSVTGSAQYLTSGATRPLQGPGLISTAGAISSGGFLLSLLNWPRNDDARNYLNPDGSRRRLLPLGAGTDADADNPYWTADKNPQTDRTNRFIGNVQLSFTPFKWVTLSHNIGTDLYTSRNTSVRAVGTSQAGNQNGGLAETVDQSRLITATTLATFSHNFLADKLRGSLILGNTIEENKDEAVDYVGLIFQNPDFIGLNNTVNRNALQRDSKRHLIGNFARLSMTIFDQLIVELQGRYDQSSTLPRPDEGKIFGKGFFYGSAAVGYEFTKVLGLDQNAVLNYGKIRASVADVGRDTGPYRVLAPLTTNTYIGGGFRNDFFGSNPNLKPERTRTYEAGINLQFFKNRLSLDFNYYRSRTTDQLIAPRVSQATGFILQYINGGVVTNEGQEISLSGTPIRTASGFSWDIGANFYHNTNNVESLPSPLTVVYQSDTFITNVHEGGAFPGHPISGIATTDFNRVTDPNSQYFGQVLIGATGYPSANPTFVYAGDRAPRFTTQVTNTFSYKGLALTSLLDFRVGGVVVNGNDYYQTTVGTSQRTTDRYQQVVFDGVVAQKDAAGNTTYVPNTRPVELTQNYYTAVLGGVGKAFVEDGSWVRLRYVALSYALPTRWLGGPNSFLKGIELNVTGRNLILLTKYRGADPETASSGAGVRGGGSGGIDYGNIPATRGVDMGLRVNF